MKIHLPILLALALTGTALAQGPLTPPPGADPSIGPVNALTPGGLPQPTMKTLHQVEPRTAIAGGSSGVTINQSGAYYLTGNITVGGGDGIVIAASGVNLDLNGFCITATAAAGTGIRLEAGIKNTAIRNGSVGGGFAGGVGFVSPGPFSIQPVNVRVSDLIVSDVTASGILFNKSNNNHVERCLVSATTIGGAATGISATVVSDCSVQNGGINGRIVRDCAVTGAGDFGIVADVAQNCSATATGTAIFAKCLVNCYGTGGGNSDVISAGVAQNVWAQGGVGSGDGVHATVVSNSYGNASTGIGINADVAANTAAQSNGTAIQAKALANAHGTGGGDHDVVSTGLAQNVWAEGGVGSGDGVHATVVSNSYGKRESSLEALSTGAGIEATIVHGGYGIGGNGDGVKGDVLSVIRASSAAGKGANGVVIHAAHANSVSNYGLVANLTSSSFGDTESGLAGVLTAKLTTGAGAADGLVDGSIGQTKVTASAAGIQSDRGLIVSSLGAASTVGGGNISISLGIANVGGAVLSSQGDASHAANAFVPSLFSRFIQGSCGLGPLPTNGYEFKFNSN